MTDVLHHNVTIPSPMASRSPIAVNKMSGSPLHSLIEKLNKTSPSKHSCSTEENTDTSVKMVKVEKDLDEFPKETNKCVNGLSARTDLDEIHSEEYDNVTDSKPGVTRDKTNSERDGDITKSYPNVKVNNDQIDSEQNEIHFEICNDVSQYASNEKTRQPVDKDVGQDSVSKQTTEDKIKPNADTDDSDSDSTEANMCNEIKERALKVKLEPRRINDCKLGRKDINHSYGNHIRKRARNFDDDLPFTDDEDSDDEQSVSATDKDGIFMFSKLSSGSQKDRKELLKFAEVLYKCTLCTSIPSILTSEESFLQHVNEQHLGSDDTFHQCKMCSLKLRTEEDLKEHVIDCHTENDDNMSCDITGSDVIQSYDHVAESNNESDSDSSGHRQLRAKVVKRNNKPKHDFESPKQLVDHTGIEAPDGSLDLTQKNAKLDENRETVKSRSPLSGNDGSEIDIKQITDQIIKSDVQGRTVSTNSSAKLPFIPSSTPEFGKYTKLVREGGNIVYFCQVCNWKSPIKTTFQVHCNASTHKNKVSAADNPDVNYDSPTKSTKSDKSATSSKSEHKKDKSSVKHSSSHEVSFGPKMPNHNLFYNYIMRPRAGSSHCRRRTPIVSPYGTSNFIEDARFTYKRPNETPVDLALKKRKRLAKHIHQANNSDSDSDEERSNKLNSTKANHLSSMTLLRQKLLEGSCSRQSSHSSKHSHNEQNIPTDLSIHESRTSENGESKNQSKDSSSFNSNHAEQFHDNPYKEDKSHFSRFQFDGNSNHFSKDHEKSTGKQYRCFACSFEYNEVDDYERHFDRVHKAAYSSSGYYNPNRDLSSHVPAWIQSGSSSSWNEQVAAGSRTRTEPEGDTNTRHERNGESVSTVQCEMGENWRVQKLKELLPDYVVECERGNTSRDYLLQCVSNGSGMQDAVLWSSACNRAMRELFPNSQAQRKGKYKKTYYFGISMLDMYNTAEEVPCTGMDGESPLYQPHRDINVDMEKIVEHLPSILKWTGNMETGVHRQDLLMVLADAIQDTEVGSWGAQCNRALRLMFPHVDMKRKGKYKTTMYLGVEFHKDVQKSLARYSSNYGDRSSMKSPINQYTETHLVTTEPKRSRTLESLLSKDRDSPEIMNLSHDSRGNHNNSRVTNYQEFMKMTASDESVKVETKFNNTSLFGDSAKVTPKFENSVLFKTNDELSEVKPVVAVENIESDKVKVKIERCDDNDGDDERESMDS